MVTDHFGEQVAARYDDSGGDMFAPSDLSAAMVTRLRAKPDAEPIRVTIGDFATTVRESAKHVSVRQKPALSP